MELAGNPDIDPNLENEVKYILEPRESLYKSGFSEESNEVSNLMERVLNNDPALTELDLSRMNLGARNDALTMFDALAENTYIESIDLSQNEIDDDCVSAISLALVENTSIKSLNLANNAIYSSGAEYLIGTLDTNKTLVEIDLTGNMIDHDILEEINEILSARRRVPSRMRTRNSSKLSEIFQSIKSRDPNLTELNLDGIDIANSPEQEELIQAFSSSIIRKISMNDTGMDDMIIAALSLALVDNTTITHISLQDNGITSEGCEYLLGTLDSNTTITHLDLRGNPIDDHLLDEIDAILSSRQIHQSKHSPIHDDDMTNGTSLNEERSYESSYLSEGVSLSQILQRVETNDPTLTELLLDNRNIDDTNALESILDALAQNSHVACVSLCNCGVDDTLVAALSLALVDNSSITDVLLSDNQITSEGCEYVSLTDFCFTPCFATFNCLTIFWHL